MNTRKDVMDFEPILPPEFDGVFRFSNPFDEDFVGVWNKKEYLFPAKTMTPLIMSDQSPLEVQQIRKKFAKDLAEREFYKSKDYKMLSGQEGKSGNRNFNSIHQAATYTLTDLEPFIQKCLTPMPEGKMVARPVKDVPLESILSRNDDGELNSQAIDQKTSLKQKALQA